MYPRSMNRTMTTAIVFAFGLAGCPKPDDRARACHSDNDCKGDRICVHGACEEPRSKPAKPAQDSPQATVAQAPPSPGVNAPEQQSYPLSAVKTIPESCSRAHVILASAPSSVGPSYEWPWTRQAMLANQQFRMVSGRPSAHGEVTFDLHRADRTFNDAWVLVARCSDGSTCNYLAAMYKAVVKSSRPEPLCGGPPSWLGRPQSNLNLLAGGPRANLPRPNDTVGKCARISACTIATHPSTVEDVGIDCQRAPARFKLDCATRYPCAEVMACLGR